MCHRLPKFGSHLLAYRRCGGIDKFLGCHVILQDHMIKGSSDIMGRSPSRYVTILPSLMVIATLLVSKYVSK